MLATAWKEEIRASEVNQSSGNEGRRGSTNLTTLQVRSVIRIIGERDDVSVRAVQKLELKHLASAKLRNMRRLTSH